MGVCDILHTRSSRSVEQQKYLLTKACLIFGSSYQGKYPMIKQQDDKRILLYILWPYDKIIL